MQVRNVTNPELLLTPEEVLSLRTDGEVFRDAAGEMIDPARIGVPKEIIEGGDAFSNYSSARSARAQWDMR